MTTTTLRLDTKILRKEIKRSKKTLAQLVAEVLQPGEVLTAKEVIARILDKVIPGNDKMHEIFRRNIITDLSKDFNAKLLVRLHTVNVDRKENQEGVLTYFLTK